MQNKIVSDILKIESPFKEDSAIKIEDFDHLRRDPTP